MTARLLRAIEHPYVNVIGHPTSRSLGHRSPVDLDLDEVFRATTRTGTAMEVNSFPDRLDLSDEHIGRARRFGVRFVISTDAHAVAHLDYMRFGVATAQRGWAERADVVNTWPLAKLRRFLAEHPRRAPEPADATGFVGRDIGDDTHRSELVADLAQKKLAVDHIFVDLDAGRRQAVDDPENAPAKLGLGDDGSPRWPWRRRYGIPPAPA